jgi:hypothetical protein
MSVDHNGPIERSQCLIMFHLAWRILSAAGISMMKRYVHSASSAPSTLIGDQTTARWRDPSEWSSRLQSNQALQRHEGCTCASERLTETRFAHSTPPPLHRADETTGHQVYVLNTTPTTSVPLFLIPMDIELKPYAMLPNLPSEYEADRFSGVGPL